jgi:hypothetical protein
MMDVREVDRIFFDYIPNFAAAITAYDTMGPAYVGCYKGKPIIIVGCIELWPSTAELWMVTDTAIKSVIRPFWMASKRLVDIIIDEMQIVRLQAAVCASNRPAISFIKALHFQEEGLLRCYGPEQSDFFMFSRLTQNGFFDGGRSPDAATTARPRPRIIEATTGTRRAAAAARA